VTVVMRRAVAAAACAIGRESEEAAPASTPATTPQQQAEQIDTGLDRCREVADKLAELEPPPDIAPAHAMFVAGLHATADDAEKLVRARHDFSEKGYDLGGVSEFP